jgi:N-methylhydantoinase B
VSTSEHTTKSSSPVMDSTTMAVLSNRLAVISDAMSNTLLRTARSGIVNTARDYSCAILTAKGELLSLNQGLPIHVVSADVQGRSLTELQTDLNRGDAYLHNSPYHGNTHAADWTIMVPVMDDEGNHRFTCLAKAHMGDTGNSEPTTYFATAKDVYQEGALIFPAVKVQTNYEHNQDIVNMCRLRIRAPDNWWGDYLAVIGSARIGERHLEALAREIGWDTLDLFVEQWLDYSERSMTAAIQKLPGGQGCAKTRHDPFPGMPDEGYEVNVIAKLDSDKGMIEIDLRDNGDCLPCGMNLSQATSSGAAIIGVLTSIGVMSSDYSVPLNDGTLRRIKVRLREGCAVGIPVHPASCSVATLSLADRVCNAVCLALSTIGDGIGMGEASLPLPPSAGVLSGTDPRPGKGVFVSEIVFGYGGGMGGPISDGWMAYGHSGSSGMMYRESIEISELQYPIRITAQRLIPDSEGAGRRRGAPAVYGEFEAVDTIVSNYFSADGVFNPTQGTRGALGGAPSGAGMITVDGKKVDVPPVGRIDLNPGERITSIHGGGGGYGLPIEREPDRVNKDVKEGIVSRERAETVYGVIFDDELKIDLEKTQAKRAALAAE